MRIEDLDTSRVEAAGDAARRQLADLRRLGLEWDGEPVWQSHRQDAYDQALRTLRDRTYECFCTRREIAEASVAPHAPFRPYPGTCARLGREQAARLRRERPGAIRIRSEAGSFTVTDIHSGLVTGTVDDFVLMRGDGVPAYNLAVVVDDMFQAVTRVTRGADLLPSAPRQAWLTHLLGGTAPEYAHVGLVTRTDGVRLAKRDGGVTLSELNAHGWSTPDVLGMLSASLGLGPCGTAEDALARMPTGLPGPRFWAMSTWDGSALVSGDRALKSTPGPRGPDSP